MLESQIECRLKQKLEKHGFKLYKLTCPGKAGVMDRMILRPERRPGPPVFVECKRPGETPRPLQLAVGTDWLRRGVDVRRYVSTYEEVDALVAELVAE